MLNSIWVHEKRAVLTYISTESNNPNDCADDQDFNCAQVANVFNICADPHHAQTVCRKFCGICSLGKHYIFDRLHVLIWLYGVRQTTNHYFLQFGILTE